MLAAGSRGLGTLESFAQAPVTNLLVEELVKIQTEDFSILVHTQVHEGNVLERKEEDAADNEGVGSDGSDLGKLFADLHTIAVKTTRVAGATIQRGDPLLGKDTGEERAHHATNTVELEDLHAIVDSEPLVEILERGANDRGKEADEGGDPDGDVTRRGGDTNKTSDGTLASTDKAELALVLDEVNQNPAENTSGSSGVGVEGSHHGTDGTVESGTTVEAEPTEPWTAS
jgi:hypothetical protein